MSASSNLAITVVGSINVDFSVRADKLPLPGESVVGDEFLQAFGGKGANQAVGIARLSNRRVRFIGAVGDDDLGKTGVASLNQNRINTNHVRVVENVNTGVALIMIDAAGENCIAAAPGANDHVDIDYIQSLPDEIFTESELFVICQEIPVESIESLVLRAKEHNKPVLFNPAPPNPRLLETSILQLVDFLTPNETEAAAMTGLDASDLNDESGRNDAFLKLASMSEASIALTLGKSGCLVFDREQMKSPSEAVLVSPPEVQPVDTTAAGDSFNAALAVGLTEGKSFMESCHWANQCAAISVTRRGAQPSLPYRRDLGCESQT